MSGFKPAVPTDVRRGGPVGLSGTRWPVEVNPDE